MPSPAAMMMREGSTVSEPVKTAATIGPTESEIATRAYQLWQDDGCPVGSDKEDWFLCNIAQQELKGNPGLTVC